jgi:prevent-host-death family protein
MGTMNLKEARKRLGEIVNAAEKGECTTITRRGRKVASIGPLRQRRALPDLTAFRASLTTKGKPLSETVIESRREMRY